MQHTFYKFKLGVCICLIAVLLLPSNTAQAFSSFKTISAVQVQADSQPAVSSLYIEYIGEPVTAPVTLTKEDFRVTAIYEDSSSAIVTDYTFTSKLQITKPGETEISVSYGGKLASCMVTYTEGNTQEYYSVTFDSMGGSEVPPILSIKPNSTIRLPENPENYGYWFRGWYLDENGIKEFDTSTKITEDLTLYAQWEPKAYEDKDIMSTYIIYEEPSYFFCNLSIDLADQPYGVHVLPDAKAIPSSEIADAAKNISPDNKYFAFRFDVEDYNFSADRPLETTITLPYEYNANNVHVYYTPDEKKIQGQCHGESKTIDTYTFSAYAPGTYIVMEDADDTLVTPTPEPTKKPSIKLSLPTNINVNAQYAAQITFSNFDEEVLAPDELTFTWKSSNPSVATVNKDGVITGIKKGTVTITVTSEDKQFSASAKVTIGPKKVLANKLTLNKTKVTIKKGKSFTIKATISPSNTTNKKLKYSSGNKKIATVSSKGVIKAKKKGSCTVKVATTDGSKLTKSIKVTVK